MKPLFLLLSLLLLSACATHKHQVQTGLEFSTGAHWKRIAAGSALCALSGASWGIHETVVHHPGRIPQGWNRQFWDNSQSWRNKYRNGDPAQGSAYWGSTTFLAWSTDAKHLFGTLHRTTLFAGAVVITLGEHRPMWHYLADAGIGFVAFSLGFHSVYSLAFRS